MVHTIKGTNGADTLTGTAGDDNIYGYNGNDILIGGKGDDWLFGGSGSDTMTGGAGTNDYWGAGGKDTIVVSARGALSDDLVHDFKQGVDKIDVSAWGISDLGQIQDLVHVDHHGNATFDAYYNGIDHIMRLENIDPSDLTAADFVFATGGPASVKATDNADVLFGSAGDNTINGKDGDDTLLGGGGNDTLVGGFGLDNYDGGAGTDTLSYAYSKDENVSVNLTKGTATFSDGAQEFLLSIENVTGSQVNDTLVGTKDANVIDGQAGNDKITGGFGADTLTGGKGADNFIYNAVKDSPTAGTDTITDFASGDHIDLRGLEHATAQDLDFVGTAAFTGTAGELRYEITGGNTVVSADIDGNGTGEFSIVLTGSHALASGDFLL